MTRSEGKNVQPTPAMIIRMRELHSIRLSLEAIRRVIELDYGRAPCVGTIRRYLRRTTPTRPFVMVEGVAGIRHDNGNGDTRLNGSGEYRCASD